MRSSTLIFLFIMISLSAFGQFRFGAGIETDFGALGIAAKGQLDITEEWGGQIGFNWYLNSPNQSRLDIDAVYLMTTAGDNDEITLKGLGGLNYWNSGVTGMSSKLGLNIGANITFPLEDQLFYIEPRVTIISVGDFFIGAGLYF